MERSKLLGALSAAVVKLYDEVDRHRMLSNTENKSIVNPAIADLGRRLSNHVVSDSRCHTVINAIARIADSQNDHRTAVQFREIFGSNACNLDFNNEAVVNEIRYVTAEVNCALGL